LPQPVSSICLNEVISPKFIRDQLAQKLITWEREADLLAIEAAKQFGIDLSRHVARQVTIEGLIWCDLVLVMDHENLIRLKQKFPMEIERLKVQLMSKYLGSQMDIPDPYRKDELAFRESFQMINSAAAKFVDTRGYEKI
jgi:low molecular weight protein-tyrosine phosphatase